MLPSLEFWGSVGGSVLFGQQANPQYNGSITRVGALGEIGLAYRSSYFIDPHLSVAYASLARGDVHLPAGQYGPAGDLNQHLAAWLFSPGFTAEIWRLRFRLGLGFAVVKQSFTYQNDHSSSSAFAIMHQLGVGFNALDSGSFRLDAEVRAVVAPGVDMAFLTLNVVARGDIIEFGRSNSQVSAR